MTSLVGLDLRQKDNNKNPAYQMHHKKQFTQFCQSTMRLILQARVYDVKGFKAVWLASRKIESNARKQNSQQALQILLSTEDTDHYQWYEDLRVILVVWIDKFRAFYKKSCACEMLIK